MDLPRYVKTNVASFQESPLNHLDIVALTWITYFDMPKAISHTPLTLAEWKGEESYTRLDKYYTTFMSASSVRLLKNMVESPRFENVRILEFDYEKNDESNMQFGAIVFEADGRIIIAFEGTDFSYVGWREDFVMSYSDSIASYDRAIAFVKGIIEKTDKPIIITGHSKGGNVASYCLAKIKDDSRIEAVYSIEGPGFYSKTVFTEHPEREEKLIKFIPHDSIVGIMLNNEKRMRIVKTYTVGIFQHNPLKWAIKDNDFVYLKKRTASSRFIDISVNNWLASLSESEKRRFTKIFFTNLEAFGPDDFSELCKGFVKYIPSLTRAYNNLEDEDRVFFNRVMKSLRDQMFSTFATKSMERFKRPKKPKNIENKRD